MDKVLFVATVTSHINTFHIPYLKWFKEQGYEVHVASKGEQEIQYCDTHYEIPFERFPLKKSNIKAYKKLKKIIDGNNYKIIHCHTPVAGILTRLAARETRKNGTKVIYTAHGFHFYKGAPLLNWIIYYPIEKICSKWTDCLITINGEDYELAKKKMKAKKVELVYGVGMNTKKFERKLSEKEKQAERQKLAIGKKDIVFTYVAELNRNKNQILLINAMKDLKNEIENIKLLLVGNGKLYDEYENIIKKEHLDNNVKLLGKRTDINEILSITDIYLASSIREGLPVNIMEAMYKEIPIIATNNRGHRDLIKDNLNGKIINNNDLELAIQIKKLLDDNEKQYEFKSNCKKMINKYIIDNVMESMKKIYSNYRIK